VTASYALRGANPPGSPIHRGPAGTDTFRQICDLLFRDRRLSLKAKGVLGLILIHRDGLGVTAELIAEWSTDGVPAVRAALRELEHFGYLTREQCADTGDAPIMYSTGNTARTASSDGARPSAVTAPSGRGAAGRHGPPVDGGAGGGAGGSRPTRDSGVPRRHAVAADGGFLVGHEVQEVLLAFPGSLREAMRTTAHTDRPRALVTAVERELRRVSRHRLVERVRRRWISHGYARLLAEGTLKRPVGAAVAMVKAGSCPNPRCEDGWLEDGEVCRACEEREKDRRAEQARQPQEAARRQTCPYCGTERGTGQEPCGVCVRRADAARREVSALIDSAVGDWAAVPDASAAEKRSEVESVVARACADAADAGAAPAGQALAARLAALEEARRARAARDRIGPGDQAGLPASSRGRGHRVGTRVPAQATPEVERCPGSDGSGCPDGRAAVGSEGLCVRCRTVAVGAATDHGGGKAPKGL
jgi:hypothetical protein